MFALSCYDKGEEGRKKEAGEDPLCAGEGWAEAISCAKLLFLDVIAAWGFGLY